MPEPSPRVLTFPWGSETIQVSNLEASLPATSDELGIDAVIEAGTANPQALLTRSAWGSVARASTQTEGLAVSLRSTAHQPGGLLMAENVDGATLWSAVTRVHLSELLPGIQPRTGMEAIEVADPQVKGVTDAGRPCATVQFCYRDLDHLRDHVWQTINGTLSLNSYAPSILARKVTRNLITHPVEIHFEDGTDTIHAVAVRDGITRYASAWSVLAGPSADASETATLAVESLFGKRGAPVPAGVPLDSHLATVREKWRTSLRQEYAREMSAAEPGARAAQIGQTAVVPAQIAVGVEGHPGHLLAPEDLFDDAIRSVLASVHVEFKQWDDSAQNIEVATRALQRVIQQGDSLIPKYDLQRVYGLAVGRIPVEELPKFFPADTPPPATALWRAVFLVHALTRPELLNRLKDQAKAIKGGKRMGTKGFAELLGPIIDQPWRSYKKHVTKQARNAWNNGGVLTSDIMGEWDPVPTDDFTTLIGPAMAGDTDARCTLAAAGGIALISDKLVTRNVGSALNAAKEKGGVPFRVDVNQVIEDLSRPHNELGLWTLALTANRFRADALPENAVTMRQLIPRPRTTDEDETAYVHLRVDLAADGRVAKDSDGVPETLYQWDVVWASNPERALKAHPLKPLVATGPPFGAESGDGAGEPIETPTVGTSFGAGEDTGDGSVSGGLGAVGSGIDPAAGPVADTRPASLRAADHRHVLRQSVISARDALDSLQYLEPQVSSHTPIVPLPMLDDLIKQLVSLQADVEHLRRSVTSQDEQAQEEDEEL